MTTITTATRRGLLAAVPAVALAAAIPTRAVAMPSRAFEAARANFLQAHQRLEAAAIAHTRMEEEQAAFPDAPTRVVTYTEHGWTVNNAGIKIEAQPKNERFELTRSNIRIATPALEATPEFAAYKVELAAWNDRYAAQSVIRGWDAIKREWNEALDAKIVAWRKMVECPVSTPADMAEKLRLARMDDFAEYEEELVRLVDAIQADTARLLAA